MISDKDVEKALNFYRDEAAKRGALRGQIAYLEHAIKIALAQAFLDAEGTVAEREARSRLNALYQEKVEEYQNATADLGTLETYLKAAELKIEVWRTQNANQRRGNI